MNKETIQMMCSRIDLACENIAVVGSQNMAQILGIKSAVRTILAEVAKEDNDGGQAN